ncbi:MAG: DUF2309 domain-containing protein [Minicystis sp.]
MSLLPPWLSRVLEHTAHYLPAQAPLEVFVHHNTLHAFQHLQFHDAVESAGSKLGAAGYLDEARYREAFRSGRISEADLDAALARWLPSGSPELPPGLPEAKSIAKLALIHDLAPITAAGLTWQLTELGAGVHFAPGVSSVARDRIARETVTWLQKLFAEEDSRDRHHGRDTGARREVESALREAFGVLPPREALARRIQRMPEAASVACLWRAAASLTRAQPAPSPEPERPALPRDAVLAVGGDDPDDLVNPVLILLAGAFLDRGQSHWSMPDREEGFFVAFQRVLTAGHAVRPSWLATLGKRLRRWKARKVGSVEVIEELLTEVGVEGATRDAFVENTLLRLPGWAGMFHRLESAPGPIGRSPARARLLDFLAVRLCLDVLALAEVGRRIGHHGPLAALPSYCAALPRLADPEPPGDHARAWPLFLLAQHAGLSAPDLLALPAEAIHGLLSLLSRLDRKARARIWHEAYERHYREDLLRALHARRADPRHDVSPRFQAIFCIDDRAESLRRHFEEMSPAHETFGAAGFFNLAIAYQGIDDPATFPLCPVVVTPRHRIEEEPIEEELPLAEARRRRLRRMGRVDAQFRRASRSLVLGPLVTALTGLLAAIPLLASVFAPWFAGRLRDAVARWILPSPKTRLTLPRSVDTDASSAVLAGFSVEEKASRVGTLLENLGLVRNFSRLVAVVGHDSSSVNNPHFAAYSCGACGGRSGGPNARLFARMANRPEVRERLRAQGIDIPASTVFVGGVHDTSVDSITLFDVDDVPAELVPDLAALQAALDQACHRNAHERCRRFASAPRDPSLAEAHRHVEERSYDLSQARPELGHATNASCVVGRRSLTKGLFLDRRTFLVSYDPAVDADGAALERILVAVGPVGAGINLEYFFSTTDNERFGAGTKLPHNVTGLFAVMNGASSDLRTGLPKQMIEIHEPVRLQLVVEARPESILRVADRQPAVRELVDNEWVRVIAVHPDTGQTWIFDAERGFESWAPDDLDVPEVRGSMDWYRGKDGFLPPARIVAARSAEVSRVA